MAEPVSLLANDLMVAITLLDLLQTRQELPSDLREMAQIASRRLLAAAERLKELQSSPSG